MTIQQTWNTNSNKRHTTVSSSISLLLNGKQPEQNYLPTPNTPDEEEEEEEENESTTTKTENKPHICKQCDQSFSRAHNLKSHLATHSAERPFQCTICNHYFRRQHDLKRHQKLHTGERPYTCRNCGRSFARLDALNRHQRAENGSGYAAASVDASASATATANTNHSGRNTKNNTTITKTNASIAVSTINNSVAASSSLSSPALTPNTAAPAVTVTRPVIPQLNIPNPASKPISTITSPLSLSPTTMSLPPLRSQNFNTSLSSQLQPPPYRSWSYPNTTNTSPPSPRITLPSPDHLLLPLQQQVHYLEQENLQLKQEIKEMSIDKARVHDLEVENKLLKSLIQNQRLSNDDIPMEEQVIE